MNVTFSITYMEFKHGTYDRESTLPVALYALRLPAESRKMTAHSSDAGAVRFTEGVGSF